MQVETSNPKDSHTAAQAKLLRAQRDVDVSFELDFWQVLERYVNDWSQRLRPSRDVRSLAFAFSELANLRNLYVIIWPGFSPLHCLPIGSHDVLRSGLQWILTALLQVFSPVTTPLSRLIASAPARCVMFRMLDSYSFPWTCEFYLVFWVSWVLAIPDRHSLRWSLVILEA